jgi:hypothetical protein
LANFRLKKRKYLNSVFATYGSVGMKGAMRAATLMQAGKRVVSTQRVSSSILIRENFPLILNKKQMILGRVPSSSPARAGFYLPLLSWRNSGERPGYLIGLFD